MDALLEQLGVQAMRYAIRSGVALTSTFAISQCSRLLKTVDDKGVHSELKRLQGLLNSKIKIISPAMDLIEFKSGRGNVALESAVPLTKSLHRDIASLGRRLEHAASAEERSQHLPTTAKAADQRGQELRRIITDIKDLLARIDKDVQFLQLAIQASGESLSSSPFAEVSPSRLLQAGAFLMFGDTQYASDPSRPVQIGPAFTLSLYMLFLGHANGSEDSRPTPLSQNSTTLEPPSKRIDSTRGEPYGFGDGARKPLWQEVIHKARVRLCRTPFNYTFDGTRGYRARESEDMSGNGPVSSGREFNGMGRVDEFAYHLEIIEDLDDGRAHDDKERESCSYDDITLAGIRESIPIHQMSKMFYTDTGRILNIGNATEGENNPVLLLKRDINAPSPRTPRDSLEGYDGSDGVEADFGGFSDSEGSTDQDDIDRQLRNESHHDEIQESTAAFRRTTSPWMFPGHLDPEWIAFEVFEEDDEEDSGTEDEDNSINEPELSIPKQRLPRQRSSLDSNLVAQIRNISIRSSPTDMSSRPSSRPSSQDLAQKSTEATESFVAKSPFGAIASSLSLMEMLIRMTSLQEFQQASYLTIKEHIMTFFLEETSTTGLRGEEQWRVRKETKRRVGFDPYTDTPTK